MIEALSLDKEILRRISQSTLLEGFSVLKQESLLDLVEAHDLATNLGTFAEEFMRHTPG